MIKACNLCSNWCKFTKGQESRQKRKISSACPSFATALLCLLFERQGGAQICNTPVITTFQTEDEVGVPSTFNYLYTADPSLTLPMNTIVADPSNCLDDAVYSCEFVSGPIDICALPEDALTKWSFVADEPITFQTVDRTSVPPGDYAFRIIGTVEDISGVSHSAFTQFEVKLTDPCGVVPLESTIGETDSIPAEVTHFLGTGETAIAWTFDAIADQQTALDCGPRTVEFSNADGSSFDTLIFENFQDTILNSQELRVKSLLETDVEKKGAYALQVTVSLPLHPGNPPVSSPFQVTIMDACDAPIIEAPDFNESITYVLTDDVINIGIPLFTTTPAQCSITYDYSVSDFFAQTTTTFSVEADRLTVQAFGTSFNAIGDHVATIKGISGATETILSFDLFILNPCDNSNTMELLPPFPIPPDQTFTIESDFTNGPLSISHNPVVQKSSFWAVIYCSQLTYVTTFDGKVIPTTGDPDPITYSYFNFNVATDDINLVGTHTVVVKAYLMDYPEGISATFSFKINFLNPCTQSSNLVLMPTSQDNPADYFYSGSSPPAIFTLNPFDVEPAICALTYSCEMTTNAGFDLCDDGTFSSSTGNLIIATESLTAYPPGDYEFKITGRVQEAPSVTTDVSFSIKFVDPCLSTVLQLDQVPFEDKNQLFFSTPIEMVYDVQALAFHSKSFDCGVIAISFTDGAGGSLDPAVFNTGLAGTPGGSFGQEIRTFTILTPAALSLNAQTTGINYKIYLKDYPSKQLFGVFEVSFELTDECDVRLVSDGFQASLPDNCEPDEPEPPTPGQDPQTLDPETPSDPEEPVRDPEEVEDPEDVDDKQPTEEELAKEKQEKKAIEFTPFWMRQVVGQRITYGSGVDLHYEMGDPVTFKGDLLNVTVDFGGLNGPAYFDEPSNSIHVINERLNRTEIGTWDFVIDAVYREINGTIIKYTSEIFLQVIDPDDKLPQPIPQISPTIPQKVEIQVQKQPKKRYDKISWDVVRYESALDREQTFGPLPYVKSYSWTGQLKIGWTTQLVPYQKPSIIPAEKVAIEEKYFLQKRQNPLSSEDNFKRRSLREKVLIFDQVSAEEISLLITDAIKIRVLEEDPDHGGDEIETTSMDFTWEVEEFLDDQMTLQFYFTDPEKASDRAAVNFDTFEMIFYGTKYFKDREDREVPFGTKLEWRVFRQIDQEGAEMVYTLTSVTHTALILIGLLAMLIVACCGPLLPFWMFVNTLQLVAHLPMLRTRLPASANIFFLEYLTVVRLHVWRLNDRFEKLFSLSENTEDYDFIRNHDSEDGRAPYNELLHTSGYHVNIVRNLMVVTVIGIAIILIWLQVAACDRCCSRRQRDRFGPWWSNFFVRFLYEVFFEVCISLTLTLALVGSDTPALTNMSVVVCSIIFTTLTAFGIGLLTYLCFKNGPYAPNSFEKGSLIGSVWGHRQLRPSLNSLISKQILEQTKFTSKFKPNDDVTAELASEKQSRDCESDFDSNRDIPVQINCRSQAQDQHKLLESQLFSNGGCQEVPQSPFLLVQGPSKPVKSEGAGSVEGSVEGKILPAIKNEFLIKESMQSSVREDDSLERDKILVDYFNSEENSKSVNLRIVSQKSSLSLQKSVEVDKSLDSIVGDRCMVNDSGDSGGFNFDKPHDLEQDFFEGGEADAGPTANPTANCSMVSEVLGTVADEQNRPDFPCGVNLMEGETNEVHLFDSLVQRPLVNFTGTNIAVVDISGIQEEQTAKLPEEAPNKGSAQKDVEICDEQGCKITVEPKFTSQPLKADNQGDFSKGITQDISLKLRSHARRSLAKLSRETQAELATRAKVAVILEGQVRISARYETLFLGLRRNHPHNCALIHPLAFILRRVIYAAVIVFMFHMPFFGTLILLAISFCLLTFAVVERQWEEALMNQQHVVNETVFYVCLVFLVLFCDVSVKKESQKLLGWVIIGLIMGLIVYNAAVIGYVSVRFGRLQLLRYRSKRSRRLPNKVVPMNEVSSVEMHTGRALLGLAEQSPVDLEANEQENQGAQKSGQLVPIIETDEEQKNSSLINDSDLVKEMVLKSEAKSFEKSVSIRSGAPKSLKEVQIKVVTPNPDRKSSAKVSHNSTVKRTIAYQASFESPSKSPDQDSKALHDSTAKKMAKTHGEMRCLFNDSEDDGNMSMGERSESIRLPKPANIFKQLAQIAENIENKEGSRSVKTRILKIGEEKLQEGAVNDQMQQVVTEVTPSQRKNCQVRFSDQRQNEMLVETPVSSFNARQLNLYNNHKSQPMDINPRCNDTMRHDMSATTPQLRLRQSAGDISDAGAESVAQTITEHRRAHHNSSMISSAGSYIMQSPFDGPTEPKRDETQCQDLDQERQYIEPLDLQKSEKWFTPGKGTQEPVSGQKESSLKKTPKQESVTSNPKSLKAGPKFMKQRGRSLLYAANSMIESSPAISKHRTDGKRAAAEQGEAKVKGRGKIVVKRGNLF